MKTLLVAFIAGLGLIGGTANAEGDFAIGGSVGQVTIGDNNGGADFDGDDIAYKVFANWMMNDYFGFEGGYVDFGDYPPPSPLGCDCKRQLEGSLRKKNKKGQR